MSWLPLEVFPFGGLASSVITTVWIGVIVITFFNLRFGTTLSGLVVPGYLIPLFIVKPASAWVILLESLVTYVIARVVAERGLVRIGLGEMFGRDRFFILILISVLVRILFDAFILPDLSDYLADIGAPYELRSGLHSFGLIIIALCANMFWNGGFKIGAITLAVYLGVTFVIIDQLLIPYTNFNISTLGYMYEDVASSVMASPKAYIILITAAFIASRLNLRYGWDFNGILIPSLLALQWYAPAKILTTFIEAFVIYFGARLALRVPPFSQMNIEGARQILLFFSVGFVYKMALGFAVIYWFPDHKVTDYYGFGYLLGTLMAVKMHDKGIAIRLTRTTLQTSLVAAILASALGFSMTMVKSTPLEYKSSDRNTQVMSISDRTLGEFVAQLRTASYQSEKTVQNVPLSPLDADIFHSIFSELAQLDTGVSQGTLRYIASRCYALGFDLTWLQERYLVLHDNTPERGWGFYVVDLAARTSLAVEVPRAQEEVGAAAVADRIFARFGARYLAYSGARSDRSSDGSDDVLLNSNSLFQIFHQALAVNNTLQLRGYSDAGIRQLFGTRFVRELPSGESPQSTIWVKRSIPDGLPLADLKDILGSFAMHWRAPEQQNRQRDTSMRGFVEIYVSPESVLNIYGSSLKTERSYAELRDSKRIAGYLQSYLAESKQAIATRHSERYVPADKYDLLYFDQSLLAPLSRLVQGYGNGDWQSRDYQQLAQISSGLAQFGYELLLYRHIESGDEFLIVQELDQPQGSSKRHWGTFVIKLGVASNYVIEIPAPYAEQNTFEFGSLLFEELDARAILVAGANPLANADGSARVTASDNMESLFNLVHQRLLADLAGAEPLVLQIRGYQPQPGAADDVLLAPFRFQKPRADSQPAFLRLREKLEVLGLPVAVVDALQLSGRQARFNAQSRYLKYVEQAQYAEIWLPFDVRQSFQRFQSGDLLLDKFSALGVVPEWQSLAEWLPQQVFSAQAGRGQTALRPLLEGFLASENIQFLAQLKRRLNGGSMQLVADRRTLEQHLIVRDASAAILVVINLNALSDQQLSVVNDDQQVQIGHYLEQRARWLWGGD